MRGSGVAWRGAGGRAAVALEPGDLVLDAREPSLKLVRAQETELPVQVELGFTDGENDYRRAAVASRRLAGTSRREARTDTAVVTRRAEAQRLADSWLQDLWAARETAELALPSRSVAVEPGDILRLPTGAGPTLHGVVRIADGPTRRITTRAVEPAVYEVPGSRVARPLRRPPAVVGPPEAIALDLPAALGDPRRCNTWPLRPIPGPARSRCGARETGPHTTCIGSLRCRR